MASYAETEAGTVPAQTISGYAPTQQQHFQQQPSPQHQHQHSQQQQQQQQQQQYMSTASAAANNPAAAGSNNPLNLGLGFLRGLGLERKTNRDGQPPKRRGPKPDSKPALTRRQELNRQAQRTHRQRKEVYIKSLEDQVMQLKELFAIQAQERSVVDEENRKLREIIHLHGIPVPTEVLAQLAQQHHHQASGDGAFPSNFSSSDGGIGPGASDYATPSSYHASGSESAGPAGPGSAVSAGSNGTTLNQAQQHHLQYQQHMQQQQQHMPEQLIHGNPEENQLGIDFVLASVTPSSP